MAEIENILTLNAVRQLPPLEYAIQDLLPRHGVLVIGGPPKKGKSRLVLDIALCGVQEHLALGLFATRFQKVLLVNAEGGHYGLRAREEMYEGISVENLDKIHSYPRIPQLTLPTGTINHAQLEALAKDFAPYDLVVLDPLISFHQGADENSASPMQAIMNALRDLNKAADCSMILVHHVQKGGSREFQMEREAKGGEALRGSGVFHGSADGILMFWADGQYVAHVNPEIKHGKPIDSINLIVDRITGRFYRHIGDQPTHRIPDVTAWKAQWGDDAARFSKAFQLPEYESKRLLEVA